MDDEQFWAEFEAAELKRQRVCDVILGAVLGVVVLGLLLFATGCNYGDFGEGAIWTIRPYHDWRLWLVP